MRKEERGLEGEREVEERVTEVKGKGKGKKIGRKMKDLEYKEWKEQSEWLQGTKQ